MNSSEQELLAEVSLDEPWALVESFSTYKREHPRDVDRGMDEVVSRLQANGVEVIIHEPNLYLSLPGLARVEAGGKSFRAKPPAFSINASNGVEGELVYVGANQADSIDTIFDKRLDPTQSARAKVEGKIVISEGFASPGMITEFQELGAIGVIGINPGIDIHWGICTSIWGTPDLDDLPRKPTVVSVAVSNPDGRELIELAKQGTIIKVFAEMEEGWFKSKLPEVIIRGSEEPDKYVLLHGHLDSWDVGVGDNATGDATMLEVARVLWKNRDKLKRSVKIAWWPGHSTGRYGGSTWYADEFALDLEANCVAQVNCDSPGCRWATEYIRLSCMSETADFLSEVIADVTGKTAAPERPHRAGDYSFNNIGIPSYLMLSSTMTDELREEKGYYAVGGCGGNIAWHTENDILEIANKDTLIRDIKLYLLAMIRNANADVLPVDWRKTTAEFLETVDSYQQKAGNRFDLSPTKDAVHSLHNALGAFYAKIESGAVSSADANTVIHDLARLLVPINYTREQRFRHDPALTVPPLPAISTATEFDYYSGEDIGFALTQLHRGQNRVIATLRQAERHIGLVCG